MRIDDGGLLTDPDLHDGHLLGLELEDQHQLRVRLRDQRGAEWFMRLIGLKRLLASDFREGNIILELQIFCGKNPEPQTVRWLIGEIHSEVNTSSKHRHESFIDEQIAAVRAGKLTLASISASYGCSLAALCDRVEIAKS